jgi:hypothetical protein
MCEPGGSYTGKAGFQPWEPGFMPRSVHVDFVVDKVALRPVSLQVLRFSHQYHSSAGGR